MNNLSIRIKYSIPLLAVVAALVIVVFANSMLVSNLEKNIDVYAKGFVPATSKIVNADRDLYQARLAELQFALNVNNAKAQHKMDFNENAEQALERFEGFESVLADYPDILEELRAFDATYATWLSEVSRSLDGDSASLDSYERSDASFSNLRALYDQAGELTYAKSEQIREEAAQAIAFHKTVTWILVFVIVLVAVAATYISQKRLISRIDELTDNINDITSGGGDLTRVIDVQQQDELGELGIAFNRFVDSLRTLVTDVRQDVTYLKEGSERLDSSSQQSSSVALQQSKSVEMIVSAVHEMSIATKEMAEIAQLTADETQQAMEHAESGVKVINQSVEQIGKLYQTIEGASTDAKKLVEESNNISSVLDVIRGIAEQTNLLALNAAIEAARAGEQGRGFAVVADEVRTLASKTQESTDSIQSMIEGVQAGVSTVVGLIEDGFEKVTNSVELAQETEKLLTETSNLVSKVKNMSIQTATATEEQTAVTEDINANLHELNGQTEITSEVARDTHSAAKQILELAENIHTGITRFKVS